MQKLWFLYKTEGEKKGMSPEEMSRYIQFLFEQIQQKDAQHKELLEQITGIKQELNIANSELRQANSEQKRLNALVLSLTNQLNEALQTNNDLSRKLENMEAASRISKKHHFGSSSQKGITMTEDVTGRDD